jgi:2-succinyl-5-enolpyruvyl-6-hydroxy-3-cyclohexene-1-carboxylate synthase
LGRAHPNRCDGFAHLLASPTLSEELAPDLILQVGQAPSSGSLGRWLDDLDGVAPIVRFSQSTPRNSATGGSELVLGEPGDALHRLCNLVSRSSQGTGSSSYLRQFRAADERAWAAVATHLAAVSTRAVSTSLGEAEACAATLGSLAPGSQLTLGNSLAIRSADLVVPGQAADLRVLHQRGTSGIDGLIAGAIGSSGAAPSALLLGDVSCAHDLGSLALASKCRGPLRIFLIDNGGGRIFSQLPIARQNLSPEAMQFWHTTPAVDFEKICAAFGVPYHHVAERAKLQDALHWSRQQEACSLLHLQVEPDSMQAFSRSVQEALS